jgi:hypothetical protein
MAASGSLRHFFHHLIDTEARRFLPWREFLECL